MRKIVPFGLENQGKMGSDSDRLIEVLLLLLRSLYGSYKFSNDSVMPHTLRKFLIIALRFIYLSITSNFIGEYENAPFHCVWRERDFLFITFSLILF